MKKRCLLILGLTLWLACPSAALAEDVLKTTWDLPELRLQIALPEDFPVVTRAESTHDQFLAAIEIDPEELRAEFPGEFTYLWALDSDLEYVITVNMLEYEGSRRVWTYANLSDQALRSYGEKFNSDGKRIFKSKEFSDQVSSIAGSETAEMFKNEAINITYKSLYRSKAAAFMVMDVEALIDGSKIYGRQYTTIHNGQSIYIKLLLPDGQRPNETQDQVLKAAVDSVFFTATLPQPEKYKTKSGSPRAYWINALTGVLLVAGMAYAKRAEQKKKDSLRGF